MPPIEVSARMRLAECCNSGREKNMRNQGIKEPPFRLRQERASRIRERPVLEAWPSGQGDYYLAGRNTYPIRESIKAVSGRWDDSVQKWFVTKEQARKLGALVLCRVLRAPCCCERLNDPEIGVEAMASEAEVAAGRMTVPHCPHCGSFVRETVAIRDLLDLEGLPELASPVLASPTPEPVDYSMTPPWEG